MISTVSPLAPLPLLGLGLELLPFTAFGLDAVEIERRSKWDCWDVLVLCRACQ